MTSGLNIRRGVSITHGAFIREASNANLHFIGGRGWGGGGREHAWGKKWNKQYQ